MNHIINIRVVFKVISRNLLILSIALITCIGVALWFSENILPFLLSGVISFLAGLALHHFSKKGKNAEQTMKKKDTYLTVTLSWLTIGLVGCLPYLISGFIPSFIDAYFESVSGFTTTGASILTDIEALPKSILFWRSLTHWIGGIGIIVLVILIMPSLKIGGYHLFSLESSLQEKIKPRIRSVGLRLLYIYVGLTLVEFILLLIGKMPVFESVCHAFGTIATGGFSPKNSSIAGYSPYIQYVVMLFMLLSGMNFVLHYFLLKGEFAKIRGNEEFKLYIFLVLVIGLIISAVLFFDQEKPLEVSVRESYFQVISIITCTGYATADYLAWPEYAWILIFIAMFFGGCTGSTAGGIKMARHVILLKNIRNNFRQVLSPHAIFPLQLNNKPISAEVNSSVLTFICVYLIIFMIGATLMMMTGVDMRTAGGAVASCMAGIGPGLGTVGPVSNYAHLTDTAKLLLSFLMIVGRLEIFTVIVLFSPGFWKK